MKVGLHYGHIMIEIELNFILDLKKRSVVETLQMLIQLCEANMRLDLTTCRVKANTYRVVSCRVRIKIVI